MEKIIYETSIVPALIQLARFVDDYEFYPWMDPKEERKLSLEHGSNLKYQNIYRHKGISFIPYFEKCGYWCAMFACERLSFFAKLPDRAHWSSCSDRMLWAEDVLLDGAEDESAAVSQCKKIIDSAFEFGAVLRQSEWCSADIPITDKKKAEFERELTEIRASLSSKRGDMARVRYLEACLHANVETTYKLPSWYGFDEVI